MSLGNDVSWMAAFAAMTNFLSFRHAILALAQAVARNDTNNKRRHGRAGGHPRHL